MNLFENLQIMTESDEIKTYNISFKRDEVYQANLIKGYSEEQVTRYFKEYKPDAEILGVKLATRDDDRPGKPVIDATKDVVKEADPITDDPAWEDTFDDSEYLENEENLVPVRFCVTLYVDKNYVDEIKQLSHHSEYILDLDNYPEIEYIEDASIEVLTNESAIIKDEKDIEKVVESTEFRQFTTRDWAAWGGAEKFKDGSEPLILEGEYATLIVGGPGAEEDEDGVYISIYYGDDDNPHSAFRVFSSKEQAIKFVNRIKTIVDEEVDEEELKNLTFDLVV